MRWAISLKEFETARLTHAELADQVFWRLWRIQLPPYKFLAKGDDLWLTDKPQGSQRFVTWRTSVGDVISEPYASRASAAKRVSKVLGLRAAEFMTHQYTQGRPDSGYLLAFTVVPLRAQLIPYPRTVPQLRQEGFANWTDCSDALLVSLGLLPTPPRGGSS